MVSLNKKHAVRIVKMIKELDLIIFESNERKTAIPKFQVARSELFQSLRDLGYELNLEHKIVKLQ